jgi:anti-sigma B factor antagonist
VRGVRVRDGAGEPLVALDGEIDQAVVGRVAAAIDAATGGASRWTLDLTAVTYLDSEGLRMLLDLARAAGHREQVLTVVPPRRGMAHRALEVSGLHRRLGIAGGPAPGDTPGDPAV